MNKQIQIKIKELIYDKLVQKENEKQNKEVGTVLTVKDGVVQIYGMKSVQAGEMVEFIGTNLLGLTLNLGIKKKNIINLKLLIIFLLIILLFLMHAFKVIFDHVLVNKGKYFPGQMPITLSENYIKLNLNKQNAMEVINTVSGGVIAPKIGIVHSTIAPTFLNTLVNEAQKTSTNMAKDILYHQNTIRKGNCDHPIKIHSEEDRFFLSTGLGIAKALSVRRVVNESVCTHSGTVLITDQFGIVHRETTEYIGMFELSNGYQNLDIHSRIRTALVIRFDVHLVNDPRFKITKQKTLLMLTNDVNFKELVQNCHARTIIDFFENKLTNQIEYAIRQNIVNPLDPIL